MSDASVGEMMAPKFTQPLKDLTIKSGQRVCLQCRVSGHPMPEVQWFMDTKQLESSPDFQVCIEETLLSFESSPSRQKNIEVAVDKHVYAISDDFRLFIV